MLPTDRNPSRARLRQLAWLLALLLALAAYCVRPTPVSLSLRIAGASVFAAGTLWPNLFAGPYLVFIAGLYPLAWLVGRLLRRPDLATSVWSFALPARPATLRKRRRPAGFRLVGRTGSSSGRGKRTSPR